MQKREKRAKIIKQLELSVTGNSLIQKFKHKDLQLINSENAYHSPEDSETEPESESKIIVVKDLKWRSSAVSIFSYFFLFIKLLSYTNYF